MCLLVERIRMRRRWPAENAAQEADDVDAQVEADNADVVEEDPENLA